jgi:hypothetical protein
MSAVAMMKISFGRWIREAFQCVSMQTGSSEFTLIVMLLCEVVPPTWR